MIDFSRGAPKLVSADEAKREELAKLASELDWRSQRPLSAIDRDGGAYALLAHHQAEPRPAGLGHALIEDILIERVHEAVARRRRAVRHFDDGRLAQELLPPRHLFAHLLDLHRSFFQAGGHRGDIKLRPGHAGHFQRPPLVMAQTVYLFLDHLPDALRRVDLYF